MTWLKIEADTIIETRGRPPGMDRKPDTGEWTNDLAAAGWHEATRPPRPDDADIYQYTGDWTVVDGAPVYQWTRGDLIPEPEPDPRELERDVVAWDAMVGRALVGAMRAHTGPLTGEIVDQLATAAEDAVATQVATLDLLSDLERAALVELRHAEQRAKVDAKRAPGGGGR